MDNDMNHDDILRHLGNHPWSNRIELFDEVTSTNTMLKALGQQGAPHGTVILSDRQTGGRGRLGRSFLSPGGAGIYLSALIRPNVPPTELMHLTCAAAVAMCDAVEKTSGLRPSVKWINDLVIGRRKLGGILTELSVNPTTCLVDFAVIGIGINCLQTAGDFPPEISEMATSLRLAAGKDIDRSRLAAEMVRSLSTMSECLLTDRESIMEQYCADCITVGKDIQVLRGDTVRYGRAVCVNADGSLLVAYPDGTAESVSSGEVSVRGMYGYV